MVVFHRCSGVVAGMEPGVYGRACEEPSAPQECLSPMAPSPGDDGDTERGG